MHRVLRSREPITVPGVILLGTILVVSTVSSVHAEAEFSRSCTTAVDCVFEPNGSSDRVYLDCQNGRCVCFNFAAIADVPKWNLNWTPSSQDCLIDEFGPCGKHNGLEISCNSDLQCINLRCRSNQRIRTHKHGEYCKDDIDCEPGLKCKLVAFYLQPQKSCMREDEVVQIRQEVEVGKKPAAGTREASVPELSAESVQNSRESSIITTSRNHSSPVPPAGETVGISFKVNDRSPPAVIAPTPVVQIKTNIVVNDNKAVVPTWNHTGSHESDLAVDEDDDDMPIAQGSNKASADFQPSFFICLAITVPISIFSRTFG